MNKFWHVHYNGLWLGGCCVVIAKTADEAIEIAKQDKQTVNFKNVRAEEVQPVNGVIYNSNGDY